MPHTDYESVIRDLTAWVAEEKPGYGRQELLEKIAALAKEHAVPESLLERAARLHGNTLFMSITPEPDPAPLGEAAEPLPEEKDSEPGPPTNPKEVHDGTEHAPQGAAVPG